MKLNPDKCGPPLGPGATIQSNNPLTKREYLAVRVMQGMFSDSKYKPDNNEMRARDALAIADALIVALNEGASND